MFCSLGPFCHSSQLLKRNELKECSYPFDWIFSNCKMILDCLDNDFNIFLDKSYYIPISESCCGHSKYNDRMFNHHNPLIKDHDYFVRCVQRFRTLLQSTEHKVFLMMFVNMRKFNKKKRVIEFNRQFSKYTTNYTLVAIFHKQGPRHHTNKYKENIHFIKLQTPSKSDGVSFDETDNQYVDKVLSMYND